MSHWIPAISDFGYGVISESSAELASKFIESQQHQLFCEAIGLDSLSGKTPTLARLPALKHLECRTCS